MPMTFFEWDQVQQARYDFMPSWWFIPELRRQAYEEYRECAEAVELAERLNDGK